LTRALAAIVHDARRRVAAGADPGVAAAETAVRRTAEAAGAAGSAEEARALEQLARVAAVHRARTRVAPEAPAAPQPARRPLRGGLKTRPSVNANMDVRPAGDFVLAWEPSPAVVAWEVRISERPDPRSDYVVRETRELAPAATSVELPVGENPLRVHVLGRARDGRLVRRAVVSALTRESWGERWQRKGSAA
jgi:hypothetical protein